MDVNLEKLFASPLKINNCTFKFIPDVFIGDCKQMWLNISNYCGGNKRCFLCSSNFCKETRSTITYFNHLNEYDKGSLHNFKYFYKKCVFDVESSTLGIQPPIMLHYIYATVNLITKRRIRNKSY